MDTNKRNELADQSESQVVKKTQLQMIWPEDKLENRLSINLPEEYELRTFQPGDTEGYLDLMYKAGFNDFTSKWFTELLAKVIPNGLFVIEHSMSKQIVATTMCIHNANELHSFGGELSWVAAHPDHSGKRLGVAVCSAVVNRFLDAGYSRIYLKTDDFRLAAIKTYLKMGFAPFMFSNDMPGRWEQVLNKLDWER